MATLKAIVNNIGEHELADSITSLHRLHPRPHEEVSPLISHPHAFPLFISFSHCIVYWTKTKRSNICNSRSLLDSMRMRSISMIIRRHGTISVNCGMWTKNDSLLATKNVALTRLVSMPISIVTRKWRTSSNPEIRWPLFNSSWSIVHHWRMLLSCTASNGKRNWSVCPLVAPISSVWHALFVALLLKLATNGLQHLTTYIEENSARWEDLKNTIDSTFDCFVI